MTPSDRSSWLAWRRSGLGASDAPSVLGLGFSTPLELYLDKIGELPETAPTLAMQLGILLEPVMAQLYYQETGIQIVDHQVAINSLEYAWARATLDGVRDDGLPVELKTALNHQSAAQWGENGTDQIPDSYLWQVQHQMLVTGAESVDVAVLLPGPRFQIHPVERNQVLIDHLLREEEAFWLRVVERNPPPPGPKDTGLLSILYREATGEILLDGVAEVQAETYFQIGEQIKAMETERAHIKAMLDSALGPFKRANFPDGSSIRRMERSIKEKLQPARVDRFVQLFPAKKEK